MISNFSGKERDAQYTHIHGNNDFLLRVKRSSEPGESNRAFAHSLKLDYQVANEPIRMQTDQLYLIIEAMWACHVFCWVFLVY